ncbi:MAG: DUF2089 domain-containing protein [Chloroflexi bacterium]|nr:DUF2089 domain-containing protein [Chloroflexota bacterium]MBC7254982.1 DUF2089 domain-containing protein [Chloroflexota bacterium]
MRTILTQCPNCGGEMEVTRLHCTRCETVILARYDPCPFCRLKSESQAFIAAFVQYRGNLKEMERELGQSYWSLRNRLQEVIQEMGFEAAPPREEQEADREAAAARREILERLERGEISVAEAVAALSKSGGQGAHRIF